MGCLEISFKLPAMTPKGSNASSSLTVYHYPKCSTCRKARAWLESQNIEANWVHIVDAPPSVSVLRTALSKSGEEISKFFNTSGQSYREGNFRERRASMDEKACLEALAADGKLIRRPLAIWSDGALVGFRPDRWAQALIEGRGS